MDIGNILTWKPVSDLGQKGFGIYLWHWPIYVILLPYTPDQQFGVWLAIVLLLISIGLAYIPDSITAKLRNWPTQAGLREGTLQVGVLAISFSFCGGLSIKAYPS